LEGLISTGLRRAITLLAATGQILLASIRLLGRSLSLTFEILLLIALAVTVTGILWLNATVSVRVGLVIGALIVLIGLLSMAYWSSRDARTKLPPRHDQNST